MIQRFDRTEDLSVLQRIAILREAFAEYSIRGSRQIDNRSRKSNFDDPIAFADRLSATDQPEAQPAVRASQIGQNDRYMVQCGTISSA